MAQAEHQETERVESPFGRRSFTSSSSLAAEESPRRSPSSGEESEPETAAAAPSAPAPAPARVRRLRVRSPKRLTGLRPMTGYEEELVETPSTNTAALCNEILTRCLSPVGERSDEAVARVDVLLVAERDAAIVDLRRLTFGDRVETDVECPGCGARSHVSFDLTRVALEVADVAEGLEVTLSDGRVAELCLPTARDQADLLSAALEGSAERRSWLLERSIQRLGDFKGPLGFEKVHALDSRTRRELERELELEIPDLDLRVGATCEACGREFAAPFDVASFFLPS